MKEEIEKECRKQIEQLIAADLLVPSKSEWSAAPVFIKKKEGSWRMAIDYRMVNKQLVDDSYPMPLLWEILRFAALSPESRKYTAFVTPMGTYEWTVLPFGLKTAPSEFQRVIDHTIRPSAHA
eukprot:GHVS01061603.1.p1 GENE.GHVS01061603.1~~GHVS01061603.1.p1  ORF type:complete len:123 (+),score=13.03 GHVS01061603.1:395-763(+)